MPEDDDPKIKLLFRVPGETAPVEASRAHGPASRGAAGPARELLEAVTVKQHFQLSAASRAAGKVATLEAAEDDVLALEMEEGFLLYTSTGRLADDLRRLDPEAEEGGALRLDALRGRGPVSRGFGDWAVRALSVIGLDEDAVVDAAEKKAKEWLGDKASELVEKGAGWAATKALLWAIERNLQREPGLYPWVGEDGEPGDLKDAEPADFQGWKPEQPVLVFLHGTASSTLGSFGDLRDTHSGREWERLREKFGRHIYAFEHRTFSESPIENALSLAERLPAGARLNVVSHSRGGLIGDLVCASDFGAGLIDGFRRREPELAMADAEDRKNLLALDRLLAEKGFRIERYVRVACPARGTLLASSHLDAFLSALLHLIGLVPYLQVSPVYAVAKRAVLQIVKNRTDARLVPGIEAMLPDSPLAGLLGMAHPKEGAEIAVIAGDIEGGGLLKRLGVFLTDQLFFEDEDNDLVVDTESMYGGLARQHGRYLFDRGSDVSHFRYFANSRTRRALQGWLTDEKVEDLVEFEPVKPAPEGRRVRAVTGPRPVVVFLPGIMGSHLKVGEKDRVWFDFVDLAFGGMDKIRYGRPGVGPDALFGMFYDNLCGFLEASHEVRRFTYDWRRPLADEAGRLTAEVDLALRSTELPVRLLSHSMGGLVVRMMIRRHRGVWDRLAGRAGSRWVMLGTPNRGSHAMVENLLGLSDTVRQLARLDLKHDMKWLLDTVAGFPGALQLLPRPGFTDAGGTKRDYYAETEWGKIKKANNDFWFGTQLGAAPAGKLLEETKTAWLELDENLPNAERIVYVAGCGQKTPCGVEIDEKNRRVLSIGTLHGDGTVTHESGVLNCLRQAERIWYMEADHAGLAGTEDEFPALLELLERGETARLPKVRPAVRGAEETFRYEAGPVLYPTEESLARSLLGGRKPPRRRGRARHTLAVSCRAMDLRHARDPILIGHYEGDPISGAELQIDRYVVDHALSMRYQLGAYAAAPGTTSVVLLQPNAEQARAGIQRGAIVVGLGELGNLTAGALTEAVRNGVARYLLQLVDRQGGRLQEGAEPRKVGLAALLLGQNSTANITVDDSVQAVVRGVMEGNRQFVEAMECPWHVGRLEFIELYLDVAVSAAYAVRRAAERLRPEAERLGCRLEAAPSLECGDGVQQRLEVATGFGYWPRLIVTEAGRGDDDGPPPSAERAKPGEGGGELPTAPLRRPEFARSLRFMYLSQRARAETVVQQRQPGLVERLVECSIRNPQYQPDLSRTLFQLLVPHDFKETARRTENLVLVVDGYTANLPWEMLVADEEPLVRTTAVVRQLSSTGYRSQPRRTLNRTAYIVGNPSTEGYYAAFPDPRRPGGEGLDPLPGAEAEAQAAATVLRSQGYEVVEAPSGSKGIDVLNKLFQRPYRIIHISAHGVFQAGKGESARSGVVLSDGLLLTAAEIAQMEVVPDLVFLNCCFLGKTDNTPRAAYNRLAYSVARELIEIGVRAVVAAGWAVGDEAGRFFAETFYSSLVRDRRPFGRAVHEARRQTYERFNASNTWGAFQAYGDPGFVLDPTVRSDGDGRGWDPVAPQELVARIDALWVEAQHEAKESTRLLKELRHVLKGAPRDWHGRPEVLYALGRFYGEIGQFEEASRCYEDAVSLEDRAGLVPFRAIEQLANLEARQGEKEKDEERVRRAIHRLRGLAAATTGRERPEEAGKAAVNGERCALLGSAYKRLARVLKDWSVAEGSPVDPRGIREALVQSAAWYRRGEGDPSRPGFSPYLAQNRLALEAVLGTVEPGAAQLARLAGDVARERYATSRDYWDLLMTGDGLLLERLIDGSLVPKSPVDELRADRAEQEILTRYRELRDQLPESSRELDSVAGQIDLLAGFLEVRSGVEPEPSGARLGGLVQRLRRIAAELRGESTSAAGLGLVEKPGSATPASPRSKTRRRPKGAKD